MKRGGKFKKKKNYQFLRNQQRTLKKEEEERKASLIWLKLEKSKLKTIL